MQTFLSSLITYLTEADIALIREDLKFKRDASLRVNILRTTDSEALKSLSSIGISPIAFPDIAHAYTITREEEYAIFADTGTLYGSLSWYECARCMCCTRIEDFTDHGSDEWEWPSRCARAISSSFFKT